MTTQYRRPVAEPDSIYYVAPANWNKTLNDIQTLPRDHPGYLPAKRQITKWNRVRLVLETGLVASTACKRCVERSLVCIMPIDKTVQCAACSMASGACDDGIRQGDTEPVKKRRKITTKKQVPCRRATQNSRNRVDPPIPPAKKSQAAPAPSRADTARTRSQKKQKDDSVLEVAPIVMGYTDAHDVNASQLQTHGLPPGVGWRSL